MEPTGAQPNADDADQVTAIEEAFLIYRDAGLRLPPVPHELVDRLEILGEWHFGTEEGDPTDRAAFLAQAERPESPPQIAFGHFGHGMASWWLCYRLILDALAVFVRLPYGGSYTDDEIMGELANQAMEQIEELVVHADAARASHRLPPTQRLVVVVDQRGASGWQVIGGPDGWRPSATPLDEAAAFLTA
jgi:hypothetical protein